MVFGIGKSKSVNVGIADGSTWTPEDLAKLKSIKGLETHVQNFDVQVVDADGVVYSVHHVRHSIMGWSAQLHYSEGQNVENVVKAVSTSLGGSSTPQTLGGDKKRYDMQLASGKAGIGEIVDAVSRYKPSGLKDVKIMQIYADNVPNDVYKGMQSAGLKVKIKS